jgi:hypothetical protein
MIHEASPVKAKRIMLLHYSTECYDILLNDDGS